jgi:hypothetical protein
MLAKQKQVSLNLRLPSSLHKRLARTAAESHRSLNAEIIARLNDCTVGKWSEVRGQSFEIKDLARLVARHDEVLEDLKQQINEFARVEWSHADAPRSSKEAARSSMSKKGEE